MAEERIAERIDANMMDIPMDDVVALTRAQYMRKIESMRQSSTGRVIIKEYPTGAAHAGHFRALLQELRTKQSFVPDIVFIDYLSICASSRVKMGASVNSYTYNKSIAEELRGLGVEHDIPIFTAAQFNRDGSASTDPGLDKISESFAIAQTADFIIALTTSEDLEKNNQIQVYTLKNRYGKRQSYQKFILGVDTSRMKLYETAATNTSTVTYPTATTSVDEVFSSTPKPMFGFNTKRRRPLAHLKTDSED
jgi:replicative DNA helicase